MMNLASTSDVLRIVTGAAADIRVHASWVDLSGTTVTPDGGPPPPSPPPSTQCGAPRLDGMPNWRMT